MSSDESSSISASLSEMGAGSAVMAGALDAARGGGDVASLCTSASFGATRIKLSTVSRHTP